MDDSKYELLEDILSCALDIKAFTKNKTLNDYSGDRLLKAAVERKFEIIGEALNRLKKMDENLIEQIRDSRKIISFRNILVHAYDYIEDRIVWSIIQENLEDLISDVKIIK